MLKFKYPALKSVSRLFSYRNEVDIYTEDRFADKEFYKTLFTNLLGNNKINDVTPLGCKENVLKAYDNQNKTDKRKKYFIIDGDLDLIIGKNRKEEYNLIVLDSYCIENYLIDEKGAIEYIHLLNATESKENIKTKLNFEKWLSDNVHSLVELFINFAILKNFNGGPSINTANGYLTQIGKETILDNNKINKYSITVKKDIIKLLQDNAYSNPEKLYLEEYAKLNTKWAFNTESLLKIVSAKNYLLPLLQFRMSHCSNNGRFIQKKDSIKLFLAKNSSLSKLQ